MFSVFRADHPNFQFQKHFRRALPNSPYRERSPSTESISEPRRFSPRTVRELSAYEMESDVHRPDRTRPGVARFIRDECWEKTFLCVLFVGFWLVGIDTIIFLVTYGNDLDDPGGGRFYNEHVLARSEWTKIFFPMLVRKFSTRIQFTH